MTELLERDDLLAQLEATRVEGGRLLFVGGEAGVGKISLVRAFTAAKPALHGSCENLATPTPFGPFLDVGVDIGGEPRQVAVALPPRARTDATARAGGRALGRRGDARRPSRARSQDRWNRGNRSRHLPRRRGRQQAPAPDRPRRACVCSRGLADLGAATLIRRSAQARRTAWRRWESDPSPHVWQRLLRHRDLGRGRELASGDHARRSARTSEDARACRSSAARRRIGRPLAC